MRYLTAAKHSFFFVHDAQTRADTSLPGLVCVHLALTLSRILYVAPYLPPTASLWEQLERVHHSGLGAALGFPTYARYEATWCKAKYRLVRLHPTVLLWRL